MAEPMTSAEKVSWLRSLPGETISPHQLAKAIGGDPYAYNVAAKDGKLDRELIPHMFRGRNLRIFKEPIIQLIEGRRGEHDQG